jgi:hypothetical protein
MKLLIFAFLAIFTSFNSLQESNSSKPKSHFHKEQTVYICKGPNSLRFHSNSSCRGLNSCTTQIYSVSLTDAKNIGRTPCQICY